MVNGLHLYSAFTDLWPPKRHSLTFIHSYTNGVSHARRQPARLGSCSWKTSALGQVEPGIEPPTFRFVDNLHEPLSHCHPTYYNAIISKYTNMYMNFFEFLLNCNSASFNSNSNCNSRSCFWHQFKFNSNSRIELELRSHSQFNSELCTSLTHTIN